MKMTLGVCVSLLLALLSGCERESERIERQARGALADVLIDPTDFLLKDLRPRRLIDGQRTICGEVNGRNLFGAYTGYVEFSVLLSEPPAAYVSQRMSSSGQVDSSLVDMFIRACGSAEVFERWTNPELMREDDTMSDE